MPGTPNVIFPGFCAVDVAGFPPGNTQEYFEALVLVPKLIMLPAVIVISLDGVVMAPVGGTSE